MTPKEILKNIIDNEGSCDTAAINTCCKKCPIADLAGETRSCYSYVVANFKLWSENGCDSYTINQAYKELAETLYLDMIVDEILCEDDVE